jgi:hypothetical protein
MDTTYQTFNELSIICQSIVNFANIQFDLLLFSFICTRHRIKLFRLKKQTQFSALDEFQNILGPAQCRLVNKLTLGRPHRLGLCCALHSSAQETAMHFLFLSSGTCATLLSVDPNVSDRRLKMLQKKKGAVAVVKRVSGIFGVLFTY